MKLKGIDEDINSQIARRVVMYSIMLHPQLEAFNSPNVKRLLFNLAYRHVNSIAMNAFSEEVKSSIGGICTRFYIFDILCRINHSCSPNVEHYRDDDDRTYCKVIKPIKAGEQLFINYLIHMEFQSIKERKQYIKQTWDFDCKCEKCFMTKADNCK